MPQPLRSEISQVEPDLGLKQQCFHPVLGIRTAYLEANNAQEPYSATGVCTANTAACATDTADYELAHQKRVCTARRGISQSKSRQTPMSSYASRAVQS